MSGSVPRLQVLIVTHKPEGIGRVAAMNLPKIDGIGYIVSWQSHCDAAIPEVITSRNDIIVSRFDRTGVSANRNHAFDIATAPIVLVGDDDLTYYPKALEQIISIFDNNPDIDYATFRYDGDDSKLYPDAETPLWPIPRNYFLTAFEIAIRRTCRTSGLRFREDFGPGAPRFIAGEDDMFLITAGQLGLKGRFYPHTIARHTGMTTGYRPITDPRVAQTTGAVIRAMHPLLGWLPRIPLTATRLARQGRMPFLGALKHLTIGALAYRETV